MKIDVLIVAGNARSLIANRGDFIRELLDKGVLVSAAVPAADYLPEVENLGIEIYPLKMGRTGVNPVRDVYTLCSLFRLMRRLRPDVVFGYTVKPVVYGSIAARLAGVPSIYAMITGLGHAYTTENAKTKVLRPIVSSLYRLGIGCCNKVFFQNPDDMQKFFELGILRNREKAVRINGSGINIERFSRQPLPDGPPVFLFIGRLLTEKGIAEFVQAAGKLKARWPEARFVAVGPYDPDLPHSVRAEELARWKQAGVVEFVGGVPDVRPWLAKASVFVLPSYREGTPRAVLEAMSVGRPIVTSDAPGCRETVVEGKNGFLVTPRDVSPLVDRLACFLERPGLIPQMAEASRRLVEEKYEVSKVNQVILEAMELK